MLLYDAIPNVLPDKSNNDGISRRALNTGCCCWDFIAPRSLIVYGTSAISVTHRKWLCCVDVRFRDAADVKLSSLRTLSPRMRRLWSLSCCSIELTATRDALCCSTRGSVFILLTYSSCSISLCRHAESNKLWTCKHCNFEKLKSNCRIPANGQPLRRLVLITCHYLLQILTEIIRAAIL